MAASFTLAQGDSVLGTSVVVHKRGQHPLVNNISALSPHTTPNGLVGRGHLQAPHSDWLFLEFPPKPKRSAKLFVQSAGCVRLIVTFAALLC